MKRANLLLTDQSSSGSKMTTTGHSTPSGSTRTKATKSLFSHFMFLASLLLIALLTSGKAYAQYSHAIDLAAGVTHITISQTGEKAAKLSAAAGFALPGELEVKMGAETILTKETDYTYVPSTGVITIGEKYSVTGNIEITATAKATLSTLTYTLAGGAASDNILEAGKMIYEVSDLAYTTAATVTLGGTVESGVAITTPQAANIEKQADGTQQATAEIEVTASAGDATPTTYTVTLNFKKDELTAVSAPAPGDFDARMADEDAAVAALNAKGLTAAITTNSGAENEPLTVTWTYDNSENGNADYNPAGGESHNFTWTVTLPETLANTASTELTGTVEVANIAASTDTKLATLTYQIGDDPTAIEIISEAEANTDKSEYNVALPATFDKTKPLTVNATPNDELTSIAYSTQPVTLDNNKATVTLTITAENKDVRTVPVNFARTPSTVATLASLKYQIADATPVDMPQFTPEGTSYEVALHYTVIDGTTITLTPVATDAVNAAITGTPSVTISGGTGTTTLTVTAEDKTTQEVEITFNVAKEKILSITAPTALELTAADANANAAAVLAKVSTIENVQIITESGAPTELPIGWELKGGTEFNENHGAKNVYAWAIAPEKYANYDLADGVVASGDITVVNYIEAITGDQTDGVTINEDNPYTQIGEEGAGKQIAVKEVTVSIPLENLSFNNVEVSENVTVGADVAAIDFNNTKITGTLSLNENVEQLVLNSASVGEIALAQHKATTLILKEGSTIDKISNEGELTLTNSDIAPASVAPLSMLMSTRAATTTEVINNGVFTDMTATIIAVTGAADLTITSQPTSKSTTGSSATLAVAATSTSGTVSYKWQKYTDQWKDVSGTEASLTIDKTANGTTKYRCEVKSTNASKSATTTLYTPAVTVQFYTSTPSEPSTPSTPTYTVSLDKVTGATFSKGETTTVDEGDNFSFKITLDKDYDQSKPVVTVDGKAITADADGNYTIKNIQKDIKIIVSGIVKNTATGIEENVADAPRAWTVGSTLYIHVPEAADVYVVSGAGALQQQLRGVSGDYNMQLRAGFYIVRIGEVSQKVIIR